MSQMAKKAAKKKSVVKKTVRKSAPKKVAPKKAVKKRPAKAGVAKKAASKETSVAKTATKVARVAKPAAGKFVYLFGRKTDGNGTMKPLLGGKGANLAEMCRIGLPGVRTNRTPAAPAR
jgi:pyruvate,orthophosphate dikinase